MGASVSESKTFLPFLLSKRAMAPMNPIRRMDAIQKARAAMRNAQGKLESDRTFKKEKL
jgi:hypothetical protein